MNINGFGNATEAMIEDFEQHIGFSLPEDYRQFLHEYNGGVLKDYHLFFVEELHAHIPLEVLYGLGLQESVELTTMRLRLRILRAHCFQYAIHLLNC